MIKQSILIAFLFSVFTANSNAQVNDPLILMTVGNQPVTAREFKEMYYNNLPKDSLNSPKALNNYLQLFIDFRLKVNAALDARIDTMASFKQEINEYRQKLAEPRMRDTAVENKLIKEAYERTKWDIRAEHILIKVAPDALPADTLAAYRKITNIRNEIMKKEITFEAAAEKYSDDTYSKPKGGDLGYFTGLAMIYPFETAAYNTKPGEISKPVRTKFGYHIIKVLDKRADVGKIQVAHIMIRSYPKMTPADSIKAEKLADSLYQVAKQGGDFAKLAEKYSQDRSSGPHGGVLPWFSVGRMSAVPEFEKAAFSLQNVGDVTGPVKTVYGWHIIKLEGKKPIQPFDSVKDEISARVMRDGRSELAVDALVTEVEKKYEFKQYPEAKKDIVAVIDDSKTKPAGSTPLFTLGGKDYTTEDFTNFADKNSELKNSKNKGEYAADILYPEYVKQSVLQFKNDHLEKEDPKFAEMITQYREGILLFDITDQMVWTKALKDTTGLKDFYEAHKTNYMWPERCDASVYTCSTKSVAKEVRKMIKNGKTDKEILAEINGKAANSVAITSKDFEKNDNPLVDANWKKGISDDMEEHDKVVFVNVRAVLPPQPKALNDVRGLATTDYQNYLMDQWIKDLRAKYPVNINKQVLAEITPKQ